MASFVDVHMHAMSLSEPDFGAFVSQLMKDPAASIGGSLTKGYVFGGGWGDAPGAIDNTLSAFNRSIQSCLCLVDDDLQGRLGDVPKTYIEDGLMHFRGQVYDEVVVCPLAIDFTRPFNLRRKIHYPLPGDKALDDYLARTVEAVQVFKELRPSSILTFRPFAGINPAAHDAGYIERFLERWLITDRSRGPSGDRAFCGVKLYPPLGMHPWPKDQMERLKLELVYAFCETHKIPIITHCDDQGFRTTSPREAWNATDPASWIHVLDAHPALRIDFAHVGRQYGLLNRGQGLLAGRQGAWTNTLLKLMREAGDVWSDISFTGADASFYKDFLNQLSAMDSKAQEKVRSRLMMGTDFAINLLKVDSYPDYLSRVEDSLFDDDFIKALVSDNPLAFLS